MDDDGEPSTGSSSGGNWTNEMHLNFLNSMEATFVRTMLIENNNRHHHLRLDRYLPDSLESTLDSATSHGPKKSPIAATSSDSSVSSRSRMGSRAEHKRSRKSTMSSSSQTRTQNIQHSDGSRDQVVPQLNNRSSDKDERHPRRG